MKADELGSAIPRQEPTRYDKVNFRRENRNRLVASINALEDTAVRLRLVVEREPGLTEKQKRILSGAARDCELIASTVEANTRE